MTMAIRPEAFDSAGAHPLRHVRGLPGPLRDRVGAGLVTLAAHVLIVTAIVAGLHQANRVVTPVVVTVQLDAKPLKHDELAPPKLPVLARPAAFTAAMPQITIAPPARPSVRRRPPACRMFPTRPPPGRRSCWPGWKRPNAIPKRPACTAGKGLRCCISAWTVTARC